MTVNTSDILKLVQGASWKALTRRPWKGSSAKRLCFQCQLEETEYIIVPKINKLSIWKIGLLQQLFNYWNKNNSLYTGTSCKQPLKMQRVCDRLREVVA